MCPIGAVSPYPQGYLRKIPIPKTEDSQNLFIVVPKEAPSVTNIVWAPSVAPSMAPSVAPSVIVSLICFPVPPPIFEIVSLHPDFRLA